MPVDDPAFSDELVESRDYVSAAVRRASVPGSAYRVTDHLGANTGLADLRVLDLSSRPADPQNRWWDRM
jgi:hypothetical protein